MDRERGFTLIELLTVIMIVGFLFALAVPALRNYWFVRALESSQQEVESQLRRQQQRVVAETHPLVYGLRFPRQGGNDVALSHVGVVRFNGGTNLLSTADDTCVEETRIKLPTGVRVGDVVTGQGDPQITNFCGGRITLPSGYGNARNDHYVFFFARGNANSALITLVQTRLDDRERVLCVSAVTARVFEASPGDPCVI